MTARRAAATVDVSELENLLGYNARRVSLAMLEAFARGLAVHELKPVEFSVLSVITYNGGVTSRQLCASLGILPPNVVSIIESLHRRGLIARRLHPSDRRAVGLHATRDGRLLLREAARTARQLEAELARSLTPLESRTLSRLLRKLAASTG